ncbi:MAG: hypothetical protein ACNYPG_00820 [Candidatus Porifericomitaceae bacterium WSBS_2022_MAG_OTU9]
MALIPELVYYQSEQEYRNHYRHTLVNNVISTHDGIRVYFSMDSFNHAFYKSKYGGESRNVFQESRAVRIDWIRPSLEDGEAMLFQGWDNKAETYNPTRIVSLAYGNFVVVTQCRLKGQNLVAKFITCYDADDYPVIKIKKSPKWTRAAALRELANKVKGR